jgi:Transglycosylase SLT domain
MMKTIQSRILLVLIIIFFVIGFSTSAKSLFDHFGSIPVAPLNAAPESIVLNPQAVIYPENLREYRSRTKDYVQSFSKKNREFIIHAFTKGEKYFPKALQIFNKYGIPSELQMIPVLESDFDANAVSRVGAVGYWQFMAELAREYGLHTNGKYDDRKNFVKSTIAASKYFRDQLEFFNDDLLLAVASYNCGQGRVRLAIKKSGKTNAGFWAIKQYLPFETRKFVMDFIAFNVIANNYNKFLADKMDFDTPPFIHAVVGETDSTQNSRTVLAL